MFIKARTERDYWCCLVVDYVLVVDAFSDLVGLGEERGHRVYCPESIHGYCVLVPPSNSEAHRFCQRYGCLLLLQTDPKRFIENLGVIERIPIPDIDSLLEALGYNERLLRYLLENEKTRLLVRELVRRGVDIKAWRPQYWSYTGDRAEEEEAMLRFIEKIAEMSRRRGTIAVLDEEGEGISIVLLLDSREELEKLRKTLKEIEEQRKQLA